VRFFFFVLKKVCLFSKVKFELFVASNKAPIDATASQDRNIPIWSPTSNGWNKEWNLDASFAPLANDSVPQDFAQNLSHVTPTLEQNFTAWSSADYPPVYPNAIESGPLDSTFQLPDFGTYNDFGLMPANNFVNITPYTQWNDLTTLDPQENVANFNQLIPPATPYTQWDDLTAIDPQDNMASFNQGLLPTTTSTPKTPVLPANGTNMSTAFEVPRHNAGAVRSRRSNINTAAHTCGYTGCGKVFTRPGDLARHNLQHGLPQHPCLVRGCNRRGPRAFYRTDKLVEHQRKRHGRTN
jgi:hypothetical protein